MIKKSSPLLLFIAIALIATSCTSTKKVQEHLEYNKQSVAYLMDSEPVDQKSDIKVTLTSVKVDPTIRNQTIAVKETGWAVPLLAFNYWASRKMCYQGASNYRTSWEDALQYNFTREVNRSGTFQLDSAKNSYELELTINKLQAVGPYVSQGIFVYLVFFYVYTSGDYAGPSDTELAISYQLKKNGDVIHENTFDTKKSTEVFKNGYKNKKELIQTFATSMAEATSENYKHVIQLMVDDLNKYFESE